LAGKSLKRIVLEKLALTAVIAFAGSLLVYLGSGRGVGFWLTLIGLVIVALSPVISYLIILLMLQRTRQHAEPRSESEE